MHRQSALAGSLVCVLALTVVACGHKADSPGKTKDDAAVPPPAPLALPALGVDQIRRFNFSYEAGAPAHDKALAARIRDEANRRIASGLWLVGRRSPYRPPKELGVQTSTSRGELYAFDRDSRRYFRLTHTEHQVVGFVRAASGNEVAVVGFDKIDRPKDA